MSKAASGGKPKASETAGAKPAKAPPGLIHPVVIYPFRQPDDYEDLTELYGLIAKLAEQPRTYARPITVLDRKTAHRSSRDKRFLEFQTSTVKASSTLLEAWCVDTCQMWYTGLGAAWEKGGPQDVYWLIPGDFNYSSGPGREVLSRLHDLPEICLELNQDLCIGEISTDHNNSKHLIDTYGTFALMYNWFPAEARTIGEYTERPRSEFFAIRHSFLGEMLHRRWYAYEQTVVLLLHAVFQQRRLSRFCVGEISDLPEGRESLASAIKQVERTERVFRTLWLERHGAGVGWSDRYRLLESQSEQIRHSACIVLQNILENAVAPVAARGRGVPLRKPDAALV